eukprot:scaffold193321_cov13-Tisochrysis_lutea.AAC.1
MLSVSAEALSLDALARQIGQNSLFGVLHAHGPDNVQHLNNWRYRVWCPCVNMANQALREG